MQVIEDLDEFVAPEFSVVTIGTFDGVHLGHQIILNQVVREAKKHNGKSILITFWPHPRFILKPDDDKLKLLSTFEEKVSLIKEIGVDYVIKLKFTEAFSNLSANEFVTKVLVNGVGTKKLFIGYDHHFGNNREGNIMFLKGNAERYGFDVLEIPRQDIENIGVSSTKIRNAISDGLVAHAATLLGRNYTLSGKVIHGEKRGRTLGFPTANIEVPESFKLLPKKGVYVVKVLWNNTAWGGMLNIGHRPTISGSSMTIETHLFNFEEDLYDEILEIEFIEFLRPEVRFDSMGLLKEQLEKDKAKALKLLE